MRLPSNMSFGMESIIMAGAWALIPTLGMFAWYCLKLLRLWTYFRTSVRVPEAGRRNEENDCFKHITHWLSEYLTERRTVGHDMDGTSVFSRDNKTVWSIAEEQIPRRIVFKNRQMWITLSAPSAGQTAFVAPRFYTILVYGLRTSGAVPGPQEVIIRDFLDDCRRVWTEKEKKRTRIFVTDAPNMYQTRWRELGSRPSRPKGTVVLREDVMDGLLKDVTAFMGSEEWYCSHGVPYRRGYLFHGVPGCGKSSLIMSLAGEVQAEIYIVNLSNKDVTDEKLLCLVANATKHSFLLLEDVDRAWAPDSKITFSGLLNAIDGAAGQEGKMLFMTTNHYDRLDPALIRPGRVDCTVHIPPACPYQAKGLFLNFFPDAAFPSAAGLADDFGQSLQKVLDEHPEVTVSVAELQGLLLQHKDDPVSAASSLAAYVPVNVRRHKHGEQQRLLKEANGTHPAPSDDVKPAAAAAEREEAEAMMHDPRMMMGLRRRKH
ncbi:putative mitochondrial chaperone BCS1-A [Diplonema papillatum]|nr:putative mitochondrial chaperone BCS1-A [Diplonema papillatum]